LFGYSSFPASITFSIMLQSQSFLIAAGASKKAIYAVLLGNLGIAIAKFIAIVFTGSTAMWAEAYHSASDTFNQVLFY
jgi:divalent metal cation (Fe/Co/Zn/Cd) transporter